MRKSLFSKIFSLQLIIAITVIAIIMPTTFVLIGEYFATTQRDDILQDATHIAKLCEQMNDAPADRASWQMFKMGIEFVADDSTVIVMNSNGEILASPEKLSGVNIHKLDKDFISGVSEGKRIVKLYSKGETFTEQTIVAIAPVMRIDKVSGNRTFIGAAIAMRSMPQISYIRKRILKIVFFSQAVAWLLAFIISIFLTRQITKPIKQMRNAAKNIASGNFKERINIKSKDEIGQLAQSFNVMIESLEELDTMRSNFISDVSHELRTPMTIISGFVEGIVDGTIPESEHEKYLGIVLSETKRLSRLVHELLEASHLEQGKSVLNKENIDMNRMVTESMISYEKRLTDKKINVELSLEDGGCFAYADKDSIKRVLVNLIDNAIKFTHENGKITVKTEDKDERAVITVENTGDGISKDDLKHIWERFYKTDKSRGMDKKGVGLGLHLVKKIITNHGGEIYAESEEGKYARFVFMLDRGEKIV